MIRLANDTWTQHVMAVATGLGFVVMTGTAAYLVIAGHTLPDWLAGILGVLFGSGTFSSGATSGAAATKAGGAAAINAVKGQT